MTEKNIHIEKNRRRNIFADGATSSCFHFDYDKIRKELEALSKEDFKKNLDLYSKTLRLSFFLTRYIPSFYPFSAMHALVDIAEERGLISRVR